MINLELSISRLKMINLNKILTDKKGESNKLLPQIWYM